MNIDRDRVLEHAGYTGSVEVSIEDGCLHGRVQHIRDIISYEGNTVAELKAAFIESVDGYVEHCKSIGKDPNKPYTGILNVRIGGNRHRALIDLSNSTGKSLNKLICEAVDKYTETKDKSNVLDAHPVVIEDSVNRQTWTAEAVLVNIIPSAHIHSETFSSTSHARVKSAQH